MSANSALFEKVGATTLVHAPEVRDMLSPLLAATKATITPVMTLSYQELLNGEAVEPYVFEGTFEEVRDIRVLGLHTSGTSGHPKPIYYTHLGATTLVAFLDPEVCDQSANGQTSLRKLLVGKNVGHFFPLFHVSLLIFLALG